MVAWGWDGAGEAETGLGGYGAQVRYTNPNKKGDKTKGEKDKDWGNGIKRDKSPEGKDNDWGKGIKRDKALGVEDKENEWGKMAKDRKIINWKNTPLC